VISYLIAVFIHGLWNGTVILTAVAELFGSNVEIPKFLLSISAGAPIVFAVLVLGCFLLLLAFNASLRRVDLTGQSQVPKIDTSSISTQGDTPSISVGNDTLYGSTEGDIISPAQPHPVVDTYPDKEI
jgi:hypothetical protein